MTCSNACAAALRLWIAIACMVSPLGAQGSEKPTEDAAARSVAEPQGALYETLVFRNVRLIDGAGNPPRGDVHVVVKGDRIAKIVSGWMPIERAGNGPYRVIDGKGLTLMPGLIDLHGHIHFRAGDAKLPEGYVYKLWLAHGITTIRDPACGEGLERIVEEARRAERGELVAPSIVPYAVFPAERAQTPADVEGIVAELAQKGARGLKVFALHPDIYEALGLWADRYKLPIATDLKIGEVDARLAAGYGIRTLEHWYGIPDAALGGVQRFPPEYDWDDELQRFRWAATLWQQADPAELEKLMQLLLEKQVTLDPTFAVYEVNRDLERARSLPWLATYAHPALLAFFEPNPRNHASFHWEWTALDEARWKEHYRHWMRFVREYGRRGGRITVGSDAGYMYQLYGFGTIRELELQLEAGFHPLEVLRHATRNGALALDLPDRGQVREGYRADLILVDGDPLVDLKVLYGTGVRRLEDGRMVRRGGVRHTVKGGRVYDAPKLLAEVAALVAAAKGG
ncbi:MAG: amidohydrolase family protein [Planctomycetes bacterium]|nr:amidohydrolase family protein [Planctomycetota bacterium]